MRMLEIGNNGRRMLGWMTMDIEDYGNTDIIGSVLDGIPLDDKSVDVVYMSHVLEHVPWFKTLDVLEEVYRVLDTNGWIEILVPDGEKIINAYLDGHTGEDDWWHANPEHDLDLWLNGRVFSYGPNANWHQTIFSSRHLENCLKKAGFSNIKEVQARDIDHGWINLGRKAQKL